MTLDVDLANMRVFLHCIKPPAGKGTDSGAAGSPLNGGGPGSTTRWANYDPGGNKPDKP